MRARRDSASSKSRFNRLAAAGLDGVTTGDERLVVGVWGWDPVEIRFSVLLSILATGGLVVVVMAWDGVEICPFSSCLRWAEDWEGVFKGFDSLVSLLDVAVFRDWEELTGDY